MVLLFHLQVFIMFHEYKCGCIFSSIQGRVRICESHRPEVATGDGNNEAWPRKGRAKLYPANGQTCVWSGK